MNNVFDQREIKDLRFQVMDYVKLIQDIVSLINSTMYTKLYCTNLILSNILNGRNVLLNIKFLSYNQFKNIQS